MRNRFFPVRPTPAKASGWTALLNKETQVLTRQPTDDAAPHETETTFRRTADNLAATSLSSRRDRFHRMPISPPVRGTQFSLLHHS